MSPQTLVFEIGVEELPHGVIEKGEKLLKDLFERALLSQGIAFSECSSFSTPRRLAVRIAGLPWELAAESSLKRGPKIPAELTEPTGKSFADILESQPSFMKTLTGFAKANGLQLDSSSAMLKQFPLVAWEAEATDLKLYQKDFKNHAFVVLPVYKEAQSLIKILPVLFNNIMKQLEFGETMRWGMYPEGTASDGATPTESRDQLAFPRPIRYFVSLLNDKVVPFQWGTITSDRITRGHAALTPNDDLRGAALTISHSETWEPVLSEHFVMANREHRKAFILAELEKLATHHHWEIVQLHQVLNVVTQLVEFPELLVGTFDEEFLKLPEAVIISEMVEHQKYFPVRDSGTGKLLPYFIITSNIRTQTRPEAEQDSETTHSVNVVRSGNERVLKARLRDGVFFYEQDLKIGLLGMSSKLKKVIFSEALGTYADKMERVRQVLLWLNHNFQLGRTEAELIMLAKVAKADLASLMVGEFPELQGIMGEVYARAGKLDEDLARALSEQYGGAGDKNLPATTLGFLLVMADKLVDLLGLFAEGVKATGSEDPYGLRRASTLMARLLVHRESFFSFHDFFIQHQFLYEPFLSDQKANNLFAHLITFLNARLKTVLKGLFLKTELEKAATHSKSEQTTSEKELGYQIAAVLDEGDWNPYYSWVRLTALSHVIKDHAKEFKAILLVYKRIDNILEKQPLFLKKRQGETLDTLVNSVQTEYFEEAEEARLLTVCKNIKSETASHMNQLRVDSPELAQLLKWILCFHQYKEPVESFFNEVMVNVETEVFKDNRLKLLLLVQRTMDQVLNWKKIPILEGES